MMAETARIRLVCGGGYYLSLGAAVVSAERELLGCFSKYHRGSGN